MFKDDMNNALVRFLADDKESLLYRPRLRTLAGSVTATILLSQIVWRASRNNFEPFYKFKEPCTHTGYRPGDSWVEEIGFSSREFDTALSKIGTKAARGRTVEDALAGQTAQHLVVFWTDAQRVTWYLVNTDLLAKLLEQVYESSAIVDAVDAQNSSDLDLNNKSAVSPQKLNDKSAVSLDLNNKSAVSYMTNARLPVNDKCAFTYNKEAEITTESSREGSSGSDSTREGASFGKPAQPPPSSPDVRKELLNSRGYFAAGEGQTPIEVYYERFPLRSGYGLSQPNIEDLYKFVKNIPTWRETVTHWSQRGYNPRNLEGMLDNYEKRINGVLNNATNHQASNRPSDNNTGAAVDAPDPITPDQIIRVHELSRM